MPWATLLISIPRSGPESMSSILNASSDEQSDESLWSMFMTLNVVSFKRDKPNASI